MHYRPTLWAVWRSLHPSGAYKLLVAVTYVENAWSISKVHPHSRPLTQDKMNDMVTMYDRFIPAERCPSYLSPLNVTSGSGLRQQHSTQRPPDWVGSCCEPPKRPRKKSQLQTAGCDGTGCKNQSRWHEGHTIPEQGVHDVKTISSLLFKADSASSYTVIVMYGNCKYK